MPRAAHLSLVLSSKAENASVVRQALGGLADATNLSSANLNDIGIAVTEACLNASAHAYGGAEGLLEVEFLASQRSMLVTVCDHGVGLGVDASAASFPTNADGALAGIGRPLIKGVTDHARWSEPSDGGTSVEMQFSTDPLSWEGDGVFIELQGSAIGEEELANTIDVGMAPVAVARRVLPRLLRAVAARAGFSIERHSAAQRVASMLLTDTSCCAALGGVQARLVTKESRIEVSVGPVADADAARLADAIGAIAQRLSISVVRFGEGGQRVVVIGLER